MKPTETSKLPCPKCGSGQSKVKDVRVIEVTRCDQLGSAIRRFRQCLKCGEIYKTIETYFEDLTE